MRVVTAYSRIERAALCRLLTDTGPDAPTLCEGWSTHDLAAHLVARERRPDSGPGLLVPALAGHTERVRGQLLSRPYGTLVELVASGPPPWSPFGWPGLEQGANTVEFFVHHEDVRRAQDSGEPAEQRQLDPAFEELLWRRLRGSARVLFRRARVGVTLRRPGGSTCRARAGSPGVSLVGPAQELLLYALGRRSVARVDVVGEESAVRALTETPLGI
ncbi:MAG: TIGR03085 family metal-binding protein [Carbonactinosporaceae bacterium]